MRGFYGQFNSLGPGDTVWVNIESDNGFSLVRHQAITRISAEISVTGPSGISLKFY